MMRAEILGPWGTYLDDTGVTGYKPQLLIDHTVKSFTDVVGQSFEVGVPDPNMVSILVEVDDATLAAIESDSTYFVMWDEAI